MTNLIVVTKIHSAFFAASQTPSSVVPDEPPTHFFPTLRTFYSRVAPGEVQDQVRLLLHLLPHLLVVVVDDGASHVIVGHLDSLAKDSNALRQGKCSADHMATANKVNYDYNNFSLLRVCDFQLR